MLEIAETMIMNLYAYNVHCDRNFVAFFKKI